MILAGAGMCNAGRILHDLRNNVWKEETSVMIVGYQSQKTVGRALVDGARTIRVFGEKIMVQARSIAWVASALTQDKAIC
jgi:metallo-beta-lactamase family protein